MESENFNLKDLSQVAVRVIRTPADFFSEMPKTGGFINPLIFVVFMGVIAGIIYALTGFLGLGYIKTGFRSGLFLLISVPTSTVVVSYIGAAILFIIWKLMGSQENYETAFRSVAFLMVLSPVTALLALIPYAGGIINLAVYLYFITIVSMVVHNLSPQRVWLVFGIIFVLFALWGLRSEYKIRSQQWKKEAKELKKPDTDMQKQTEEMARQFQKRAENNQKQPKQGK